ncbi:hypothetical protein MLD52_18360 [Puniceicoccaceae bacterium K14]|nr:hypothetical protein [Puniceicoccaceae bacterium K14]
MSLSNEQKQTISQRLADGASMADIQRLVNEDFGLKMTYMEVRFLIDDLEIEVPDNKPEEPETPEEDAAATPAASADATLVPEGVSVEVDKIKRPGAAMSGSVTFSDGITAVWYIDEMGRLGLDPSQEGYQPSEEDIQDFQLKLREALQGPQI